MERFAALELGLVDKLGSLNDAVDSMASKLELEDYKVFSYNNEVEFEDCALKFIGRPATNSSARFFERV